MSYSPFRHYPLLKKTQRLKMQSAIKADWPVYPSFEIGLYAELEGMLTRNDKSITGKTPGELSAPNMK
jgi:hypothetical protein